METKEFIKRVKELGFKIRTNDIDIIVCDEIGPIATVNKVKQYGLSIYAETRYQIPQELFDLCTQYARTPIDEREEEEKFYLQKMKSFYEIKVDKDNMFLILDMDDNSFFLSDVLFYDKYMRGNFKTQFTQKEIDKIKEEQHTDLSGFKQISVEEMEAWS